MSKETESPHGIGRWQTIKAALVGILICYLLLCLMGGPLWVFNVDFGLGIIVGLVGMYGWIYVIGGKIGYLIIVKRWNGVVLGIAATFIIVCLTVALAGLVVGLIEGGKPLVSYVWKPVIAFTFWGWIPMIVLGAWIGHSIEEYDFSD